MIKHVVMWRFKEESKQENMATFKQGLLNLRGIIPEIKSMEVGEHINEASPGYDMALVMEFKSLEDLNTYKLHPEHKKVSSFCSSIREDRVAVDFLL